MPAEERDVRKDSVKAAWTACEKARGEKHKRGWKKMVITIGCFLWTEMLTCVNKNVTLKCKKRRETVDISCLQEYNDDRPCTAG